MRLFAGSAQIEAQRKADAAWEREMIRKWTAQALTGPGSSVAGVCLCLCLFIAAPTVSQAAQVLSGGGVMADPGVAFTSPGLLLYDANIPVPGAGEKAVQLRMPPGTLSRLRVRVITGNVPSSGSLSVTVRINGADSVLTCSVAGTGNCSNAGSVTLPTANKRLSIRIANGLVAAGNTAFTYTVEFE